MRKSISVFLLILILITPKSISTQETFDSSVFLKVVGTGLLVTLPLDLHNQNLAWSGACLGGLAGAIGGLYVFYPTMYFLPYVGVPLYLAGTAATGYLGYSLGKEISWYKSPVQPSEEYKRTKSEEFRQGLVAWTLSGAIAGLPEVLPYIRLTASPVQEERWTLTKPKFIKGEEWKIAEQKLTEDNVETKITYNKEIDLDLFFRAVKLYPERQLKPFDFVDKKYSIDIPYNYEVESTNLFTYPDFIYSGREGYVYPEYIIFTVALKNNSKHPLLVDPSEIKLRTDGQTLNRPLTAGYFIDRGMFTLDWLTDAFYGPVLSPDLYPAHGDVVKRQINAFEYIFKKKRILPGEEYQTLLPFGHISRRYSDIELVIPCVLVEKTDERSISKDLIFSFPLFREERVLGTDEKWYNEKQKLKLAKFSRWPGITQIRCGYKTKGYAWLGGSVGLAGAFLYTLIYFGKNSRLFEFVITIPVYGVVGEIFNTFQRKDAKATFEKFFDAYQKKRILQN